MKSITAEEMRKIERKAAEFGIPPLLLMENAGKAVAETVRKIGAKRVAIFACTGNNGGDGFVAARHLAAAGAEVEVFLLGNPNNIRTEEARLNWEAVKKLRSIRIVILRDSTDVQKARGRLKRADVIVDAMLGTGARGELRDPVVTAVRVLNELEVPVVAVDVPTGVDPSTGEIGGDAVRATQTVTFHRMKKGLLKSRKHAGKIEVVSIGIPPEVESAARESRFPPP